VTSEETNKGHQKHPKLTKPDLGEFGRNEIAILGSSCANIKSLANKIISELSCKAAYVDADHKSSEEIDKTNNTVLSSGAFLEYTDKITFQRFDLRATPNSFQKRTLFNEQDLILVNGNHFSAKSQIVILDPIKNLEKKLDKLTDVVLIILKDKTLTVPGFLEKIPGFHSIPVLTLEDETGITEFVRNFVAQKIPPLYGLVLSGGQSSRMKKDKGSLNYHGINQRQHLFDLLSSHCEKTFVSCNAQQAEEIEGTLPIILDGFLQLGPMGGILSAFQMHPNAAWLAVACDLPYLSEKTINHLVENRNPSKTATAFLDPKSEFPEPLITVWEPKSYPILLQFLSQGYSCPRKVLINSDIEILKAPDDSEFLNANSPEQYEEAVRDLRSR
jgi:molybdopterin-guanine dinucleotide biosynthesis protein A